MQRVFDAVQYLVNRPADGAEHIAKVVHQKIEGAFHPITQWNSEGLKRVEKTEIGHRGLPLHHHRSGVMKAAGTSGQGRACINGGSAFAVTRSLTGFR
ncbi:hypothetical protein D3C76_1361350 [compost metagenome]